MEKGNSLRLFIISMFIVLLLLTSFVVAGSRVNSDDIIGKGYLIDTAGSWVIEDENRACFVIPSDAPHNLLMRYNSGYYASKVYYGDELLLETVNDNASSCISTYWITLDNKGNENITIEAENLEELKTIISAHDLIGDNFAVMRKIMVEYSSYVLFSVLCILFSLVIAIVNLVLRIRGKEYNRYNSLYLAIMLLCAGLCILTDSQFLSLFSSDSPYINLINFMSIAFIAPTGLLFLRAFFHEEHRTITVVTGLQTASALVIVLLHCFINIGLFTYLPVVYAFTAVSIVLFLVFSIREYKTFHSKLLLAILIAFAIFAFGGILTIALYYISPLFEYSGILTISLFVLNLMMVVVLLKAITNYTIGLEAERIEALEEARIMADAGNRAKTNLLQGVSHDIRTPLNAIIGYSRLLKKHIDDKELILQCMDKISSAGDVMVDIIDDILDVNRIESGQITITEEPLDILNLFQKLMELFKDAAEGRAIGFNSDILNVTDRFVIADEAHIERVLLNIISNAVKYTGPGGNVSFLLKEDEPDTDETEETDDSSSLKGKKMLYEFVVSDDGRGMSREYAEKVFDPFSREEDGGTKLTQGAGLGMSITKSLVEMMGGTIQVNSAHGRGTTVRIGIVLDVIDRMPEKPHKEEEFDYHDKLKGRRIFIVDDDARNRDLFKRILDDAGAESDECGNGDLAFEMIKAAPDDYYDLILMDIKMPYTNGIEVTKMIRQYGNAKKSSIPIIGLSSELLDMDSKNSLRAGMDDYLTKPVDEQLMVKKILELLKNNNK